MTVLRFRFTNPGDPDLLDDNLAWSLLLAEFVYGKARLRLEASYTVAEDGAACILRVDGEAGEAAARIFTGLSTLRLGEAGFQVRRMAAPAEPTGDLQA